MLTSKDRSKLKALANSIKPVMQISYKGITDAVAKQAKEHLYNEELIKIKVQNAADYSAKDVANDFADYLDANVVSVIGHIITMYKRSDKKGIEHIEW